MTERCKEANLIQRRFESRVAHNLRPQRSGEQIKQDIANVRVSMKQLRESQSQEARDEQNH